MLETPSTISGFHRYGYALFPCFYSPSVISDVIEWIDEIDYARDKCGFIRIVENDINGKIILNRIENTISDQCSTLKGLLLNDSLMHLLTEAFNGNRAVLFKDKLNFKPPGCHADLIHQDQASGWSKYTDYFVSVCICLDENGAHNGALRFLSTGRYPREVVTGDWEPFTTIDPAMLPLDEYKVITLKPGDIILFDSYIPHGSSANRSSKIRRNLFVTFNDSTKGDYRLRYYKDRQMQYLSGG